MKKSREMRSKCHGVKWCKLIIFFIKIASVQNGKSPTKSLALRNSFVKECKFNLVPYDVSCYNEPNLQKETLYHRYTGRIEQIAFKQPLCFHGNLDHLASRARQVEHLTLLIKII